MDLRLPGGVRGTRLVQFDRRHIARPPGPTSLQPSRGGARLYFQQSS